MDDYKDKKKLNGSIAGYFDLFGISVEEKAPFEIIQESGEEWGGNYTLNVYNSKVKNTKIVSIVVGVSGSSMSFFIEPLLNGIGVGNHYFEIFENVSKRIEFRGELKIIN